MVRTRNLIALILALALGGCATTSTPPIVDPNADPEVWHARNPQYPMPEE